MNSDSNNLIYFDCYCRNFPMLAWRLTLSFFMAPLILLLKDFDIHPLQVVDQLHENLPWHGFRCQGYCTNFTHHPCTSNRRGSPMWILSRALATQSGRNSQTKALEVRYSKLLAYRWKLHNIRSSHTLKNEVSWLPRTEAVAGSSIPSAKKWRTSGLRLSKRLSHRRMQSQYLLMQSRICRSPRQNLSWGNFHWEFTGTTRENEK